jgi:hypothetical protein
MKAANSAGFSGCGSAPCSLIFFFTSASLSAFTSCRRRERRAIVIATNLVPRFVIPTSEARRDLSASEGRMRSLAFGSG